MLILLIISIAYICLRGELVMLHGIIFMNIYELYPKSTLKMKQTRNPPLLDCRNIPPCTIAGSLYAKHGTKVQTRLHVFDKTTAENPAAFQADHAMVESPAELLEAVQSLRHAVTTLDARHCLILIFLCRGIPLFASAHGSFSVAKHARYSPVMAKPAFVSPISRAVTICTPRCTSGL
jgi:hypothetical protein